MEKPTWKTPAKTVKQVLLRAAKLLKFGFTTNSQARDEEDRGYDVPPNAPKAVKWCAVGAIAAARDGGLFACHHDDLCKQAIARLSKLLPQNGPCDANIVANWNNQSTKETVVAKVLEAAKTA